MLTTVDFSILAGSVLAVPPMAMTERMELNPTANAALIRHIEKGGVSTLLYGGNANVYSWPTSLFDEWLVEIEAMAAEKSWVLPSVGPDWGKLVDHASILKHRRFPVAMALPMISPQTPAGIARGIEEFASRSGIPLIIYIKTDNYLPAAEIKRLADSGAIFGIKYAVPRSDITKDPYLESLIDAIGAHRIVSGFGEIQALPHLLHFGLAGFTAGCVCLAPSLSMQFLKALKRKDKAEAERLLGYFLPLENVREAHNPIRVLHTAITLSGLTEMGPILPLLTEADPAAHPAIAEAAKNLLQVEMQAREKELVG